MLEQEESKNDHDTATTAVAATNRQNARERKRGMLAPSGDGQCSQDGTNATACSGRRRVQGEHALVKKEKEEVPELVFQLASAEMSDSALQSINTARRERHRNTSNASQSVAPKSSSGAHARHTHAVTAPYHLYNGCY